MGRGPSLSLLLAVLALAGCAGATEPGSEPDPGPSGVDRSESAQRLLADALAHRPPAREAPIPSGYRLRTARDADVALAFPPRWQALTARDARWPGVMSTLARANRGLGAAVAALSLPDGPLKLLGFDPRFVDGFATTASVMVVPARPGLSYARWTAAVIRDVKKLSSLRGKVATRRVELALGDALRLDYVRAHGQDGRPIAMVQYFAVRGSSTYVVTYATLPHLKSRYAAQFAASAGSLRTDV